MGRSVHSTSPSPSACQTAAYNLSVCSALAAFSAVLKWPRLSAEEAVLIHITAGPFVSFRCNTVMHSAVTHHSRWSGFFSPASDAVSSLGRGARRWCIHLDRCSILEDWVPIAVGRGDSNTQASGWGWIMGCTGSRQCLSSPCTAERVTVFYIVLLCSKE